MAVRDEIVSVNRQDISKLSHRELVARIKKVKCSWDAVCIASGYVQYSGMHLYVGLLVSIIRKCRQANKLDTLCVCVRVHVHVCGGGEGVAVGRGGGMLYITLASVTSIVLISKQEKLKLLPC